jgi:hypothetical protein
MKHELRNLSALLNQKAVSKDGRVLTAQDILVSTIRNLKEIEDKWPLTKEEEDLEKFLVSGESGEDTTKATITHIANMLESVVQTKEDPLAQLETLLKNLSI